jgi:hypothetical protein
MIFWLTYAFFGSQLLAWFAIIADVFSFQFKERKKIIVFFMIAATCIGLHYLLLERYAAAIIIGVWIIRFFISYHRTDRYLIYVFSILFTIITYVFYKDIYDVIILIWMIFVTIWVFQKDDKYLRQFMMCGTSCIILYNFLIFSPVGILLESLFLWSNLIWYYKHYIKKRA